MLRYIKAAKCQGKPGKSKDRQLCSEQCPQAVAQRATAKGSNWRAEAAQQFLVTEYWLVQMTQWTGLNALQVRWLWRAWVAMMCQLNSLRNRNDRHTEPERALSGFQFTSLLRRRTQTHIHPTDACPTALATAYRVHKLPQHLIAVLEGSSGFFHYIISIFFVINWDNHFSSSSCRCGKQTTIIPFYRLFILCVLSRPSSAPSPFSQAKQFQLLKHFYMIRFPKASYSLFWH